MNGTHISSVAESTLELVEAAGAVGLRTSAALGGLRSQITVDAKPRGTQTLV